jgi:small-conductance mechanosensitive channel
MSAALVLIVVAVAAVLRWASRWVVDEQRHPRPAFWARQVIRLTAAFLLLVGLLSIWFDDPTRLATALGLFGAGLAFALQKVVTSIAGYFVILRGKLFRVGDRIVMGGVRGDVMTVGLTQTVILEMGQPPASSGDPPDVWVRSRQYTGRVVNVPNAKVFEEAIYNYSMHIPFIWEELSVGVSYSADHTRAETILLDAARRHAVMPESLTPSEAAALRKQHLDEPELEPHTYWRLTDNWLEITVRFVTPDRGIRRIKDRMSRDIWAAFSAAEIDVASATFEVVGLPPLRVARAAAQGDSLVKPR